MADRKIYSGVDLFKYIAACLVVVIHTIECTNVYTDGIRFVLTRFAVPFFFLVSGFFFEQGLSASRNSSLYFKKYIKKLLILYFVWGIVIYGFFTVKEYFGIYENGIKRYIAILRRIFLIGPFIIWYILALILSVCFIYLCFRYNKEKIIVIGIITGFILNFLYYNGVAIGGETSFLFSAVNRIIRIIYSGDTNFLLTGIPFTGLGYLFAKSKIMISFKSSTILFLLFSVTRTLEYICFVKYDKSISVSFIFQAICFFFMAMQFPISIKRSRILRGASTVTYLIHDIILYEMLNPVLKSCGIDPYMITLIPIKLLIVIVLCWVVFFIVYKINNKYLNMIFGI